MSKWNDLYEDWFFGDGDSDGDGEMVNSDEFESSMILSERIEQEENHLNATLQIYEEMIDYCKDNALSLLDRCKIWNFKEFIINNTQEDCRL